jgi:hypothetical protein
MYINRNEFNNMSNELIKKNIFSDYLENQLDDLKNFDNMLLRQSPNVSATEAVINEILVSRKDNKSFGFIIF